jgi:membrane fusion protein, multidrug efflux system
VRPACVLAALIFFVGLAACGKNDGKQAASPVAPLPQVGVVMVTPQELPVTTELPGRIEASRTAQVRARVTGIVQKRLFTEGSLVKAGQVLFQIDPAPYRAALNSARAVLAKAQANLQQTTGLATRYRPLREANAVSQQEYVNAQSAQAQAEADVAAAQAALQTAELNLGYATVTAPISGRVGRALVTEGALVSQAEATQLATIQQIDPVYANFSQPATELSRLRHALASGQAQPVDGKVPVRIVLDDGIELAQRGKLLFSDVSVDPSSGQVSVRAEVPNADGQLLPGMYVRGRIVQAQVKHAMLLPQQAVSRGEQGDTVTVVGPGDKPAVQPVKLAGAEGANWVVLSGLKAGDRVVVDGFQKMRPGERVKPVPWAPAAVAEPGAAASSMASVLQEAAVSTARR